MEELIQKAKILAEALPYMKRFNEMTIVIKYGGSALVDENIKKTLIEDIALMKYIGFKVVIVHGGGKEINQFLDRLNVTSEFINGLRVTTSEVMEVVEMTLSGKLNKQIVLDINKHGIKAVGISGKDANTIIAKKVDSDVDYGLVGEVEFVNTELIKSLIDNDFVPVISPIGVDKNGETYNINADYAAGAIAGALNARKLVFLTDVRGILEDVNDKKSVIPEISESKARKYISEGIINGGMIPKVECCLKAIEKGVKNVHILDGTLMHCLILEIFTTKGIGTLIRKDA